MILRLSLMLATRMTRGLIVAAACVGGPLSSAITLEFKEAVASFESPGGGGTIAEAVDGIVTTGNGWRLDGGQYKRQQAVFTLKKPVTASIYQVEISSFDPEGGSHPAYLAVSVTTDASPSFDSRWTPLIPKVALLNDFTQVERGGIDLEGGRVIIRPHSSPLVLTFRANGPVGNVTGFSLELFPYRSEGSGRASLGCNSKGSLTLTEFRVEGDPLRTTNIALGRQASISGELEPQLPTWYLTDGFNCTFTHPASPDGGVFQFEFDLGRDTLLDHLVIRGRGDGLLPERLSRYRVQILPDGAGVPSWEARLHADGTNPGVGGSDFITGRDGQGTFRGRFIRVLGSAGMPYSPQIAEMETYPALSPECVEWVVDGKSLASSPDIDISAGSKRVDFTIRSTVLPTVRDLITYRWKLVGRDETWQETDSLGKAYINPLPPEGHYRLVAQARHTDGSWDQAEANVSFSISPPWWRRSGILSGLLAGVALLVWVACWAVSVRRMRSELRRAEDIAALNKERLRISRDMHDDVGARLTGLALLADRCRRSRSEEMLESLASQARGAAASLDEIVWSVNPRHDTVGSLVEHLEDHATSYLADAGIACTFEEHLPAPGQPLGLTERHHLLMASKEALQNIVKHSGAREVVISLVQETGALVFHFGDDGQGLPPDLSGDRGDGLSNMRQRLEEVGGSCETGTSTAGGMLVSLRLPLKPGPSHP